MTGVKKKKSYSKTHQCSIFILTLIFVHWPWWILNPQDMQYGWPEIISWKTRVKIQQQIFFFPILYSFSFFLLPSFLLSFAFFLYFPCTLFISVIHKFLSYVLVNCLKFFLVLFYLAIVSLSLPLSLFAWLYLLAVSCSTVE